MLTIDMIRAASETLRGVSRVTPLLESELLNQKLGFRLIIKPECLQETGSFKIRGAYTKIATLRPRERAAGVVAFSSGNHAQGVAKAASMLNVQASIVMPSDAPTIKLQRTAEYGANVITYDREKEDRAMIASDIAGCTGAILIPPYDDFVLMSGQGTVGLEIIEQLAQLNIRPDALFCPVGGGGLIAGVATTFAALSERTSVHPVEPEYFDDTARSLAQATRVANTPGISSICDSIVTQIPGKLTFAINQKLLSEGFVVKEAEVIAGMKALFEEFKIVAEPGGAVAVSAAVKRRQDWAGKVVVAIVSGGNVDRESFCRWIM
ncbi:threonine/serine dehydratase [Roseovarius sp. EL26]|uniref:threonine ammonia-lyase n=1 Tax=Roseovarius sp. EL26 TaxID=2126672 RepID=UPI000EA0B90E|nr:threonine/serine dehydratase [Roseovarius sp. EL26]